MSLRRFKNGLVAFEDKLYAVGGHQPVYGNDGTEAYDPVTDRWTDRPELKLPDSQITDVVCWTR
jgi:hypothetical protein